MLKRYDFDEGHAEEYSGGCIIERAAVDGDWVLASDLGPIADLDAEGLAACKRFAAAWPEIRKLDAKATKGPWWQNTALLNGQWHHSADNEDLQLHAALTGYVGDEQDDQSRATAALIVALRNLLVDEKPEVQP